MIANPAPKIKYKIPQDCSGYECRICIFRHVRNQKKGCELATFIPVDTTRTYEDHSRPTHKVSIAKSSTKYNRIDI
jgi:hypothetical protein